MELSSQELFRGTRAVTVGVGLKDSDFSEIKVSLSELDQLVGAIGAEVVGSVVQRLTAWNPGTLIGAGKIEEIQQMVEESKADFVVLDHHLTGAQNRNLSEAFQKPVLDRTTLIIEIFSRRALSHEGKLQVELAKNLDQYSRQVGAWHGSLSREGAGIGTRGAGEKAIEIDRRVIRKKIQKIREELEETRKQRAQHRASRRRNNIPTFALIGYTNAGKSTLLRELTKSEVFVADQVFATLDPLTRKIRLPDSPPCVLTDTVGFIRKLPTQLVEAFKATLEETSEADILLHVIDLSSFEWEAHIDVVKKLIQEFGWEKKPVLYVFNKCDLVSQDKKFKVKDSPRVFVSAESKEGLEDLKREMAKMLEKLTTPCELFFEHTKQSQLFELTRESRILKQEVGTQGIVCVALLTESQKVKWSPYFA